MNLEADYGDTDYTVDPSSLHKPSLFGGSHDFIHGDLKLEDDIADNTVDPSPQHRPCFPGGSQNYSIHRDLKLEDDIADNKKGDHDPVEANRHALQKAKSLSFGSFVYTGMRDKGKDSGTDQLIPYHNFRLRGILEELTSQHRWKECAGVVSVLLKGSVYDNYFLRHQFKYWAAMETLEQIEGAQGNDKKIISLFGLLEAKQPDLKHAINKKLRPIVRLEMGLYLMSQGKLDDAREQLMKVLREQQFRDDPVANMVYGLILYQKWFDGVSKELQLKEHDMLVLSDDMEMDSLEASSKVDKSVQNSHPNILRENSKENLFIMLDSDSSIGNGKEVSKLSGYHSSKKQCRRGPIHGMVENRVEGFNEEIDEEVSSYDCGRIAERKTVLRSPDLDRILFPIRLPVTQEQMKYMIPMEGIEVRVLHLDALRHFKVALSSSSPLLAALVPYLQLLLANGQVKETWKEIEKLCRESNHSLPFSLRARLAESMTPKQPELLAHCYEDFLCKNPASNRSIKCLIKLHKKGNYRTESLVEYIALHLDAACGCTYIWRELASCFQEIHSEWQAEHDSDRLSAKQGIHSDIKNGCLTFSNQLPRMFLKTHLISNWMLRCKWWAGRHFSRQRMHLEQQQVGNWELMTFKAACASHILGPTFEYVNDIYAALERMEEKNLFSLLKPHIHCSLRLKEHLRNA